MIAVHAAACSAPRVAEDRLTGRPDSASRFDLDGAACRLFRHRQTAKPEEEEGGLGAEHHERRRRRSSPQTKNRTAGAEIAALKRPGRCGANAGYVRRTRPRHGAGGVGMGPERERRQRPGGGGDNGVAEALTSSPRAQRPIFARHAERMAAAATSIHEAEIDARGLSASARSIGDGRSVDRSPMCNFVHRTSESGPRSIEADKRLQDGSIRATSALAKGESHDRRNGGSRLSRRARRRGCRRRRVHCRERGMRAARP